MIPNIENSMQSGKTRKDAGDETILARIDHYELARELGGGGFGTVYLAKDTVSGVQYAVKGLPPFVKNNREELENIKANFALVSRLGHTNIARAHVLHLAKEVNYSSEDVRQKLRVTPGDTLMVMEFAPGVTLSQWRKQFLERKLPMVQTLEIMRQIASAIDYAHEQKILHRDIKPANVMIETRPDGKLIARVLDFGLAAEIRSSMGRVSREIHDTSGTRPYMAPEQWLGGKQGPATDQYALAALFHELITGDVPFASVFDTGDPVVMMNVVGREPFSASENLPKAIRYALERALSKKPEDRFGSCAEFVAALGGKVAPRKKRPEPNDDKRRSIWKVVVPLACVASIAIGVWLWMKPTASTVETTTVQAVQKDTAAQADDELKREVFLMKGKASQARDRNEKEEWGTWAHFATRAKDLESYYRAGVDAFDNGDYPLAKDLFGRVRENMIWLSSNKTLRASAIMALGKANELKQSAIKAASEEFDGEGFAVAANTLATASEVFARGCFMEAYGTSTNACCLFEQSICKAGAAKKTRQKKEAEKERDDAELRKKRHIAALRQATRTALARGDMKEAFSKADELANISTEREDCAFWVDAWMRLNANKYEETQRKKLTDKYRKALADERDHSFDLDSLSRMELNDPQVLNILGHLFEDGINGTKKNKGIAREFYSRSVKAGYVKAEKRLAEVEEDLRCDPIFDVVLSGNLDKIREVVTERNPRKDIVRRSGYTLMHAAAFGGDASVLDYFENVGYDFNVQDKDGDIPFFIACANTNIERAVSAVQWFVEKKGVDVNYHNTSTNSCATAYGIQKVKLEKVFDYLVSHGAKTDVKDRQGKSLLHIYVNGTHELGLVSKALDVLDVAAVDDEGCQPIHYAATSSSERPLDLIELLVGNGANVNARIAKGRTKDYWESYTPLHCACVGSFDKKNRWKRDAIIKALIKHGADLNAVSTAGTWDGYTPLCMAAKDRKSEIVKLLIEAGADRQLRAKGCLPIHLAASNADEEGCCETLAALLKHGGSINAVISGSKYDDGDSVLHAAIDHFYGNGRPVPENNLKKVISFLIQNGADREATDADGCTPFLMAAKGGKIAGMEALAESGVNVNARVSPASKYHKGYKALHLVAYDPDEEWSVPTAEWLLSHGAGINDIVTGNESHAGENALHIAIKASAYKEDGEKRKMDFIRFLIDKGIDVNREGKREGGNCMKTPIGAACYQKRLDIVDLLLKSGARGSVNIRNIEGRTLLHVIASSKYSDKTTVDDDDKIRATMVKMLVAAGADVNAKIPDGTYQDETPLHFAAQHADLAVLEALIESGANVNARNSSGRTPLFLTNKSSCYNKNTTAQRLCRGCLLKNGTDTSIRDKYGKTYSGD